MFILFNLSIYKRVKRWHFSAKSCAKSAISILKMPKITLKRFDFGHYLWLASPAATF